MRVIEKTIYQFDELNDAAKEKARQWYRDSSASDTFYADCVIEDAVECAAIIGIEIDHRTWTNPYGHSGKEPKVYFSGFLSQGDGASFDADYRYKPGAVKAIAAHTGNNETLVSIAKRLQELQRVNFYQLRATIKQSGHYCHAYTMRADVYRYDDKPVDADTEEELLDCMRDFANWIYRNLEREYDYQNSDESVDEAIRTNQYEFTEEGELVCSA